MKSLICALTLSSAILAGGLSQASASTLSATELLQQFNLITTGDVSGPGGFHVDGRVLAGGNYNAAGSVVYMNRAGAASQYADLIVAGNVANQVHVNNGGDAVVGGGKQNVLLNGGGSVADYAQALVPQGYATTLSNYAKSLSALMQSDGAVVKPDNKYDASAVTGDTAVFHLTEAQITAQRDFGFTFGNVDRIVLNVLATKGDTAFLMNNVKVQPGHDAARKVIWNFIGFEDVTFDGLFQGTILADGARVTTLAGNIEGSVFARDFVGKSELHYIGLNDTLPPALVPLPAAAPMLLVGLGALAALGRRRKSA